MIGCLCLHGFTGGPYEVQPVTDYLEEHTNWLISVPTYPGHGEVLQLHGTTHGEWLKEAEEAYQALRKQADTLYIIGFSMGGMIGAYLAAKYGCDKLILLSASAFYLNPSQIARDIMGIVKTSLSGQLHSHELYQRYRKKWLDTPIRATREFRKMVRLSKPALQNIHAPTLIIQGESDGLVPKKSAEYIYRTIPADIKRICYFSRSKHMICHDVERDQLIEEVFQFLTQE